MSSVKWWLYNTASQLLYMFFFNWFIYQGLFVLVDWKVNPAYIPFSWYVWQNLREIFKERNLPPILHHCVWVSVVIQQEIILIQTLQYDFSFGESHVHAGILTSTIWKWKILKAIWKYIYPPADSLKFIFKMYLRFTAPEKLYLPNCVAHS
jgi:hypothetical protein